MTTHPTRITFLHHIISPSMQAPTHSSRRRKPQRWRRKSIMATPISPNDDVNEPPKKRSRRSETSSGNKALILSLQRADAILCFLCRATGKATVPMATFQAALPGNDSQKQQVLQHIPELVKRGVLQTIKNEIGFPPPLSMEDTTAAKAQTKKTVGTLHGCTKAAAKRRLAVLNCSLKSDPFSSNDAPMEEEDSSDPDSSKQSDDEEQPHASIPQKEWASCPPNDDESDVNIEEEEVLGEERTARNALATLMNFSSPGKDSGGKSQMDNDSMPYILPKQASYAGSNAGRTSRYGTLSSDVATRVPVALLDAFGVERLGTIGGRKLYQHQASAIDSAMRDQHTLVCTGTGSGKSLCFLLPVLAAAMNDQTCSSLIMFPTKALAQDQLTKLEAILRDNPALQQVVRPGVIDGDTPHQNRSSIAKNCNIILTNPDTLHAAILPGWRKIYRPLLERLKYVVVDETHMYEGVFGAHVAMVLSRLMRLCAVCSLMSDEARVVLPSFLACSATMSHPEHHFRLLCPISKDSPVTVLTANDDGSPRSAKHFFVWNPPIMNANGMSTECVTISKSREPTQPVNGCVAQTGMLDNGSVVAMEDATEASCESLACGAPSLKGGVQFYRRHAADETALLLAKAVKNKVRCIAFCKTRSLVEWVYERAISELKSDATIEHLVPRVESYRGGYSVEERRLIEQRLFKNELLAVVGTSALELGVDIGGIDITLHCGYPSSYSSLLQQAGRAGRGSTRLNVPSLSIMICFNSPSEQHLWRNPKNLLGRAFSIPTAVPLSVGLLEGHMLCAGEEFPLTGPDPVTTLLSCEEDSSCRTQLLNDYELLGSEPQYEEAKQVLASAGSLVEEIVPVSHNGSRDSIKVYKTHPSVHKPWTRVSLRSIEPINYSLVDASHPLQGGRMDVIVDNKAILDTIPYSRVFYHAHPGAVITHRGRRYKVLSMTRPPPFASSSTGCRSSCNLAAFAKPTSVRYSTRPLSGLMITIVKQMERIDSSGSSEQVEKRKEEILAVTPDPPLSESCSLAGSGIVTVKRTVHGYKKLSPVTRAELSRTEISLPPMEFDTYGLWIDTEAAALSSVIKDYDAGVHALSHALLAVAPLFVPCASSDLDCDHRTHECSRVMLFDMRAGGAGTCSQLWNFLFMPDGLLKAALDLLESCPSCSLDSDYQGGCPSCIQAGQCLKFNQDLSRRAGLLIAKRVLDRIKETALYNKNCERLGRGNDFSVDECSAEGENKAVPTTPITSPRRKARAAALRDAKNLKSARERQIVVGRPTWPLDEVGREHGRVEKSD